MTLDYSPVLTGIIKCPADGRAEIHWEQIAPGYWKSHDASTADNCQECLVPTAHWGSSFLTLAFFASAAYLGGGIAYAAKTKAKPVGFAAHPHHRVWLELQSLVADGVAFSRGWGSHRQKQPPAPPMAAVTAAVHRGSSSSNSGSGKATVVKKQKSSKEKKQGKKGAGSSEKDALLVAAPPPESRPQPAANDDNTKSAAAGGGGRWVHVPT
eukprot:SAG22_NODE_990_length_6131_cov_3.233588_2_plen_211_part_00